QGERGDEVGAGAERELDRLLEVPLSEAVELRVALELHPIDALEILEQPEVLTKPQEPRADVLLVHREPLAAHALGESLRLELVVLLEFEVLHRGPRGELDPAALVALEQERPRVDDLGPLEQRG